MQHNKIRSLNSTEIDSVSGGDFVFAGVSVTGVAAGLELAAAGGALAAAGAFGWAIGSGFNATYEHFSGNSLGSDIYEWMN